MTHRCAALTLAASLLLAACDTSKSYDSVNSSAPVPVNGVWVLQSRVLTSECEPELPERRLTVNVVQSDSDVRVFVDIDSDGSFGELVELPGTVRGEELRASGMIERAGIDYHLDLTLNWIVWGSMTGSMQVRSVPDATSTVPSCLTQEMVTAVKVGNAPLFDLSGSWAVVQNVSFASGPLQALAGSQTLSDWDIAQESGNILRGMFYVASSDTRRYLGTVNDSQIILGGTFAAYGQEFHITYSTLNADGDQMSGQLLARYGANKEFEIGWNIDAIRQASLTSGALLQVSSAEPAAFQLVDDVGRTLQLSADPARTLRMRLRSGVYWIERDGYRHPLLAEDAGKLDVDLGKLER